jgi:hypothetical protein
MTLGRHGGVDEASLIAGTECAAIMMVERLRWPGRSALGQRILAVRKCLPRNGHSNRRAKLRMD